MPEITLRGNKGSALTFAELDGNFTALGLTDGMSNTSGNVAMSVDTLTSTTVNATTLNISNLDVSKMIIDTPTSGGEGSAPTLQSYGDNFDSNLMARNVASSYASPGQVSLYLRSDYHQNNHVGEVGQSCGLFGDIYVDDGTGTVEQIFGGRYQWAIKSWTDNDNWETAADITVYGKNAGSLSVTNAFSVDKEKITAPAMKMSLTAYADLPSNPDASANGLIAMLSTDGAGTQKNAMIYADGGNWRYVSDNSTVAAS
jgi:hypothetical protein